MFGLMKPLEVGGYSLEYDEGAVCGKEVFSLPQLWLVAPEALQSTWVCVSLHQR